MYADLDIRYNDTTLASTRVYNLCVSNNNHFGYVILGYIRIAKLLSRVRT